MQSVWLNKLKERYQIGRTNEDSVLDDPERALITSWKNWRVLFLIVQSLLWPLRPSTFINSFAEGNSERSLHVTANTQVHLQYGLRSIWEMPFHWDQHVAPYKAHQKFLCVSLPSGQRVSHCQFKTLQFELCFVIFHPSKWVSYEDNILLMKNFYLWVMASMLHLLLTLK